MPKYDEVNWDNAACRGSVYTDLFYSIEEQRSIIQYEYINALRAICVSCPLWQQCLTYAFQYEDYGVWGGMTSQERESMREPDKYPAQLRRALFDFEQYGIDYAMISNCISARVPMLDR